MKWLQAIRRHFCGHYSQSWCEVTITYCNGGKGKGREDWVCDDCGQDMKKFDRDSRYLLNACIAILVALILLLTASAVGAQDTLRPRIFRGVVTDWHTPFAVLWERKVLWRAE